ncbi:hypothetical protein M9Y10_003065 [Tritrichomonas musculus]|uniref:cDENN domain-containing protein n=1 Tax=Tritrichomonas musculus TaxID=1915356 RepID=A0ABR2JP69_9EUKA
MERNNGSQQEQQNEFLQFPIYDCFLFHGRKHFIESSTPELLYKFPIDYEDDPCQINFLFPFGDLYKNHNLQFNNDIYSSGQTPIYYDSLISYHSESKIHSYTFRFECSPISRPMFLENMKIDEECYMTDIYDAQKNYTNPTCLYAFTFKTRYPFPNLFLEFCKNIICFEYSNRLNVPEIEQLIFREEKKQIKCYLKSYKNDEIKSSLIAGFNERERMLSNIYNGIIENYVSLLLDYKDYNLHLCAFGIEPLFEFIEHDDIIRILTCIFLEYSVYILGSNEEKVSRVSTSLSKIISPFSFPYSIFSIIPENQTDLLDAPFSIIAGIKKTKEFIEKMNSINKDNALIIDLDERCIMWPEASYPEIACIETYENMLLPLFDVIKSRQSEKPENNIFIKIINSLVRKKDEDQKNEIDIHDHIFNVIDCIFNANRNIFADKIIHSLVSQVKLVEENQGEKKILITSEMIKDCYKTFFNEKDLHFVEEFIQTNAFDLYKEIICKQKSKEENTYYVTPSKKGCCIY